MVIELHRPPAEVFAEAPDSEASILPRGTHACAPANSSTEPDESTPGNDHLVAHEDVSEGPQAQGSTVRHPRIIEEHHVVGPRGEDEIEATDEQGRRWYQLRPEPRRRADFIGFNYTWWLVIFVVFMLLLMSVGHGGWGY